MEVYIGHQILVCPDPKWQQIRGKGIIPRLVCFIVYMHYTLLTNSSVLFCLRLENHPRQMGTIITSSYDQGLRQSANKRAIGPM